jgi:hypothetical protein
MEPMSLSVCPFCHGERGAIGRSRMPIACGGDERRLTQKSDGYNLLDDDTGSQAWGPSFAR